MPSSAPTFLTRFYYRVKPIVPRRVRWVLRRSLAQKTLRESVGLWPVNKRAGIQPSDWPGWPDKKRFAVLLSHDVESQVGVERVRALAELEMEMGFRSSFNFIPEGGYEVPAELREWLVENDFEVGVHDLNHDGHLYQNREDFRTKAGRINRYLKEWGAVGFRSGFMLRQMDWLHDLELLYDSSTFDTDPFEPQPDGAGTIFPFRVTRSGKGVQPSYVELPYTLPQDSTLYLLLEEKTAEIWNRKLDWVAGCHGMALVNVHPDYMSFGERRGEDYEYPSSLYRAFLKHVRNTHRDAYWHVLPRELAAYADRILPQHPSGRRPSPHLGLHGARKIWIDLDNTPHVPFFKPIIRELEARGYPVLVTVRDAFQVCELAERHRLEHHTVGQHDGANPMKKALGLARRATQLARFIRREKPVLAVSHGSRAQLLAARVLGIPSLELTDYEHAQGGGVLAATWLMGPEALAGSELARKVDAFRTYPGIKEDVYASGEGEDAKLLEKLGLDPSEVIVSVRPPATEAHYHDSRSEELLERFMERVLASPKVRVVLLPRNGRQEAALRTAHPEWFAAGRTVVPDMALDGMELIRLSDLVVSGGGTMNREAAALGVPAYSIFTGPLGAVDQQLASERRLTIIRTAEEVEQLIQLTNRDRSSEPESTDLPSAALATIVDTIEELAALAVRM